MPESPQPYACICPILPAGDLISCTAIYMASKYKHRTFPEETSVLRPLYNRKSLPFNHNFLFCRNDGKGYVTVSALS